MKKITLGGMQASDIVLGCMRISDMAVSRVQELLETAVEEGINYFDHADLYGHGASEEVFAKAMGQKPSLRERIYLQSKCGIRDDGGLFRYDFSKSHILKSVDGILKRLNTDYLDALLLHRPDPLVEPEEVAEAFELLHSSGKVRSFGVSNQSPMLIELLQKYVNQPLVINQLQFGRHRMGSFACLGLRSRYRLMSYVSALFHQNKSRTNIFLPRRKKRISAGF